MFSGRRAVAQLGSAPVWGTGGRRFKSCLPDHFAHPRLIGREDFQHAKPGKQFLRRTSNAYAPNRSSIARASLRVRFAQTIRWRFAPYRDQESVSETRAAFEALFVLASRRVFVRKRSPHGSCNRHEPGARTIRNARLGPRFYVPDHSREAGDGCYSADPGVIARSRSTFSWITGVNSGLKSSSSKT